MNKLVINRFFSPEKFAVIAVRFWSIRQPRRDASFLCQRFQRMREIASVANKFNDGATSRESSGRAMSSIICDVTSNEVASRTWPSPSLTNFGRI